MSTQPSSASSDGHEVQITTKPSRKAVPTPLDQLISQFPEALQTRATWPCPFCQTEIPVPYGNLRAYGEHLKATDADIRTGTPVVLRIRGGCRLRRA